MTFKSTLETINNANLVFFGFDPSGSNSSNQWYRKFCILTSDNGVDFELVKYFPNVDIADVDVMKYGDTWYVIGTGEFYKTTDFETMEKIDMPLSTSTLTDYDRIWTPQFCKNYADNSWHVIYYARTNSGTQGMYLADFDPETGSISNLFQTVKVSSGSEIDPNVSYFNGKYYMWTSDPHLYVSEFLAGPYTEATTNIYTKWRSSLWYEGPYMMFANGIVYLYQDKITGIMPGVSDSGYMTCRTANTSDLSIWSDEFLVKAPLNMRHGCFKIVNARYPNESVSDTII